MALELAKVSTFNKGINPMATQNDTDGVKSVDASFEVMKNQQTTSIQSAADDKDSKENKESSASEGHIKSEISKANRKLKNHNTKCEFGYHEETKRVTIKVMDKDTEEVIREIPPEKTLEMIEKMWELAGFLIDEKR